MIRQVLPIAALVLCPASALATDPTAPVASLMALAETNWSASASGYEDYFSDDRLAALYSTEFAELYRKAAATEDAKEMGSPFNWDVIVNAQDGCPLENLTIEPGSSANGVTQVVARFQAMACFGTQAEFQAYRETRFTVVVEDDQSVVDDIVTDLDGDVLSVKAILRELAQTAN
ncbi:hypothetical protein GCM10011316_22470 [Roseibium aquae]|uniref:Uncharacterized protein n=2 Tax=Roseibium aquae TaxID=1323746 RepID=A0A916X270_9HYPH|nr:hypothetical protein GCM10011316_22470 [Roseibium aquae]